MAGRWGRWEADGRQMGGRWALSSRLSATIENSVDRRRSLSARRTTDSGGLTSSCRCGPDRSRAASASFLAGRAGARPSRGKVLLCVFSSPASSEQANPGRTAGAADRRRCARRGRGTCRASATRGSSSRNYFFDLSSSVVATLRHERATHLVTGFEKDLGADTLFRVEGYYKTFADLIVGGLETEAIGQGARFTLAAERCLVRPQARQIRSRLFRRC